MEAEIYNQVKTSIKQLLNIDLSYYKDEQMKRRLDSWLVRSHTRHFSVESVIQYSCKRWVDAPDCT